MTDEARRPLGPDELKTWIEDKRTHNRALMHIATRRFGAIATFYDGIEKVYQSPVDNSLVEGPVVLLTSGDSYVLADRHPEDVFRVLTQAESRFWVTAMEATSTLVGEVAVVGMSMQIDEDLGVWLIAAALRQQATAIAGPPPEAS